MNIHEKLVFNGHGLSFCKDKKILEVDGGGDYTAMWMYLIPLNCTLKNGKLYVIHISPQV